MNIKKFSIIFIIITILGLNIAGCTFEQNDSTASSSQTDDTTNTIETIDSEYEENTTAVNPGNLNDEPEFTSGTLPTEPTSENATSPETPTEATTPTESTSPSEPSEEIPTETTGKPNTPNADAAGYLAYYEMTATEQQAFIESFGSLDAFFAWHTAAKAAYEAERTPIDGSPILP